MAAEQHGMPGCRACSLGVVQVSFSIGLAVLAWCVLDTLWPHPGIIVHSVPAAAAAGAAGVSVCPCSVPQPPRPAPWDVEQQQGWLYAVGRSSTHPSTPPLATRQVLALHGQYPCRLVVVRRVLQCMCVYVGATSRRTLHPAGSRCSGVAEYLLHPVCLVLPPWACQVLPACCCTWQRLAQLCVYSRCVSQVCVIRCSRHQPCSPSAVARWCCRVRSSCWCRCILFESCCVPSPPASSWVAPMQPGVPCLDRCSSLAGLQAEVLCRWGVCSC